MKNSNRKYYFKVILLFLLLNCYTNSHLSASSIEHLTYKLIEIYFDDKFTYYDLLKSGFDLEGSNINKNSAEIIVNNYEFDVIKSKKINYDVKIEDYEKYIENKLLTSKKQHPQITNEENFRLGTMGGSYKLEEVYEVFEEMLNKYPDYVSIPEVIGFTIENRPIKAYRFGNKEILNKNEVLYTALHHAREGAGLTTLIYFLWHLLEGLDSGNTEAEFLLNNRTIYVVPVVNPDGLAYNEEIAPNGGGLWRKNRKKINDSIFGVDLNRNYGPASFWEFDNRESIINPLYDTYRGESPFSENETQAMRDFCTRHKFRLACNFHSYGEYVIFPWGSKNEETADSIWYRSFSKVITEYNQYAFGRGIQTVGYEVSGDSDDWMYLAITEKPKIFAITPEVGNSRDGFWPEINRYLPLAMENLYLNYQVLWSAGPNLRPVKVLYDYDSLNREGIVTLTLQNIGTEDATSSSKLIFNSLNDTVKVLLPERTIIPLKTKETLTQRFSVPYPYGFYNGSLVEFVCEIEQDGILRRDTFILQLYSYSVSNIFFDSYLNSDWVNDNWNTFDDHTISRAIITDSPGGNYPDLASNYLIYNKPIFIKGFNATLEFDAKWIIEPNYDVFKIEASSDSGKSWSDLKSSKMRMGEGLRGSLQDSGKFGIDSFNPEYIRQECDLSQFINKNIIIRFGLLSDKGLNFDGIFLDDIKIRFYEDLTDVNDEILQNDSKLICYPSPVRIGEPFTIKLYNNAILNVTLYNSLGEEIYSSKAKNMINANNIMEIPTDRLIPGFYFIKIEMGSEIYIYKIIAIR